MKERGSCRPAWTVGFSLGGKMIFEKFTVGMRKETEILYRMYGSTIRATAKHYLGDDALAEDCTQEVMLRLSTVLDRIGEYGSDRAKTFIYEITKNAALDMLDKQKHAMGILDKATDLARERGWKSEDRYFVENGLSAEMNAYLGRLKEKDRTIILMHYVMGMRFDEIAKMLGMRKEAVMQRASRTRKTIELMILQDRERDD